MLRPIPTAGQLWIVILRINLYFMNWILENWQQVLFIIFSILVLGSLAGINSGIRELNVWLQDIAATLDRIEEQDPNHPKYGKRYSGKNSY